MRVLVTERLLDVKGSHDMDKIVRDLTADDVNLPNNLQTDNMDVIIGRLSCNQVQMNFNFKDLYDESP